VLPKLALSHLADDDARQVAVVDCADLGDARQLDPPLSLETSNKLQIIKKMYKIILVTKVDTNRVSCHLEDWDHLGLMIGLFGPEITKSAEIVVTSEKRVGASVLNDLEQSWATKLSLEIGCSLAEASCRVNIVYLSDIRQSREGGAKYLPEKRLGLLRRVAECRLEYLHLAERFNREAASQVESARGSNGQDINTAIRIARQVYNMHRATLSQFLNDSHDKKAGWDNGLILST
jgi:hypothetical protein